jgi:hypothetical protein
MKKIILFLLIIACIGIGIFGWNFINKPTKIAIRTLDTPKPTQSETVVSKTTPSANPTEAPKPTLEYANPSVVIDAIETAVPDKKWTDLLPFMIPNVTLVKYATSCCGLITKNQAINELSYLNSATAPWNFSETNPIAKKLETNDPEHFKEMWIGTSNNYYAVGFKWNDNFLIEKISIVNDYRTITGN